MSCSLVKEVGPFMAGEGRCALPWAVEGRRMESWDIPNHRVCDIQWRWVGNVAVRVE